MLVSALLNSLFLSNWERLLEIGVDWERLIQLSTVHNPHLS